MICTLSNLSLYRIVQFFIEVVMLDSEVFMEDKKMLASSHSAKFLAKNCYFACVPNTAF